MGIEVVKRVVLWEVPGVIRSFGIMVKRQLGLFLLVVLPLKALVIQVDYRYDDAGFFENPEARVAIEAAAKRWSRIINQELLPVNMTDGPIIDGRFQLIHPATGEDWSVSAAVGPASDFTFNAGQPLADEYLGGFTLPANTWILFAGARPLPGLARAGPITGARNLDLVVNDPHSFLNRGFNVGPDSLAVLGGFVTFNLNGRWSFDLGAGSSSGETDFYTVALHEIGHGLGLSARAVAEWAGMIKGTRFTGPKTLAAYAADSGETVGGLEIANVPGRDYHWKANRYQSKIFPFGTPLLPGTGGTEDLQQLLMEPILGLQSVSRLEITNVDAAALCDIGWSIIEGDPPRPPELPISLIPSKAGKNLGVQISSEPGAIYTIQTSVDGVSWLDVEPSLLGDGGNLSWEEGQEGFVDPYGPAADLAEKFYRVIKVRN